MSINKTNDKFEKFSKLFSNDDGFQKLYQIINDEWKLLQNIKKFLEDRLAIDEQYAKDIQGLTANVDRLRWLEESNSIGMVSRKVFLRWSHMATMINRNTQTFRKNLLDDALKHLIEQKLDSKTYLEEEKRRYDDERQKVEFELLIIEKRYLKEAKDYATKYNNFMKTKKNVQSKDNARIKDLQNNLNEKQKILYRIHNDYVYEIQKYNFIDEQRIRNIESLLDYHEDVQTILNRNWRHILDGIIEYLIFGQNSKELDTFRQEIASMKSRSCYDNLKESTENRVVELKARPYKFNESAFETTSLLPLKTCDFISDGSTKQDIRARIKQLTNSINEPSSTNNYAVSDKKNNEYYLRKIDFQKQQRISDLSMKRKWEQKVLDKLKLVIRDAGYNDQSDDDENSDSDDEKSYRLEDQVYYHGILSRQDSVNQLIEKGDYLIRRNEQNKIVLSILWTETSNRNILKDSHFFLHEIQNRFAFAPHGLSKPSVPELLSFYKRQNLELRDDGVRLIRAIPRPDFIIDNDEVILSLLLGEGHFGLVRQGIYKGKVVAVKILREMPFVQNDIHRKNFINEANLLRQYKHKNIVKFLGIAALHNPLMLIMEFVEMGALNQYVKTNDLSVSKLVRMICNIADGMAYLEKNHVIHRDLAARNCLVTKKLEIKIADFGLSRSLSPDEEYFSKLVDFPLRWWAIEIFLDKPYTSQSDVWSYGITAWEVFTKAEMPYSHIIKSNLLIDAIKRGERLTLPNKCPTKVASIISSCWNMNPSDRPTFETLVRLLNKEKSFF